MRILIILFFLVFSFQSWTKADDISELEIEGISIGDSLLKFVKKEKILSSRKYTYADDEFYSVDIWDDSFKDYPVIQFHLKKADKNYEIHGVSGALIFGETGVFYPQSEKEWEEKFDREQKAKEHRENLREERLRQRELEKLQSFEKKETNVDKNFSSGLEKFKVDVTKEN